MITGKARRASFIAGLAVAVTVLGGCSGSVSVGGLTVDKDRLASLAKEKLEEAAGQESQGVVCDGDVPAKVGATQRCTLTALDGTTIGVTATVTAVNGDDVEFNFKADDEPQ
jgi:hypothetical protein